MQVKYVAYYRVSTKRQGQSGLGLEAQRQAVTAMATKNGAVVIAEYIEVETGKSAKRPKLAEAINRSRLTNATLVVAKLDRLARNAHFTGMLRESKLRFLCCDNEHANDFTIAILAAVAENEARQISERTKVALAVAKQRGRLLGSSRPGHWDGREHLRDWQKAAEASLAVRQENASKYYEHLLPEIQRRREVGESLETITAWLNEQGFVTRRNLPYTAINLRRIVARYLGEEYLEKPKTFRLPRKISA